MGEMSPEARGLLRCAGFLVWFLAGLPLFLRLLTNSKQAQELYAYHIDWGTPA